MFHLCCLDHKQIKMKSGRIAHVLVFPFIDNPELPDLLLIGENGRQIDQFSTDEKLEICYHITEAIQNLMKVVIARRYFNRNILVDTTVKSIHLIDFQFSRCENDDQPIWGGEERWNTGRRKYIHLDGKHLRKQMSGH